MTVSTKPLAEHLLDPALERVRQNHEQRIAELQTSPVAAWRNLGDFTIADFGLVLVEHGLGREPVQVLVSPPRFDINLPHNPTGMVFEVTSAGVDRSRVLDIRASGFGQAVIVTISVM